MGSVLNEIKCKKCGYERAMEDFYYKSGEVNRWCERCGYHYNYEIKRDKDGNWLAYRNGNPIFKVTKGGGYGTLKWGKKKGTLGVQFLENKKELGKFIRWGKKNKDLGTATYTKYIKKCSIYHNYKSLA